MSKSQFFNDIVAGLTATPKYLPSKYFYDAKGDALFEQIMDLPEYYLTAADLEIFETQSDLIVNLLCDNSALDIVELGSGNAAKSTYLLKSFTTANVDFTYYPIDISKHIITTLEAEMPQRIPNISMRGKAGEYLQMMREIYGTSSNKKVLLFLGSSIGNFEISDAKIFLNAVCNLMNVGDRILIGFDLKKDPKQILAAYNDKSGVTRDFNINLLDRINKELGADLDLSAFSHFPSYNPLTGACRSYLVSTKEQHIAIPGAPQIFLEPHEAIDMELSQKFSVSEIENLADEVGFKFLQNIFDSNRWYCNSIWER